MNTLAFASRTATQTHARTNSSPKPSEILEKIHSLPVSLQNSREGSPSAEVGVAPNTLHGTLVQTADTQALFSDLELNTSVAASMEMNAACSIQAYSAPNAQPYPQIPTMPHIQENLNVPETKYWGNGGLPPVVQTIPFSMFEVAEHAHQGVASNVNPMVLHAPTYRPFVTQPAPSASPSLTQHSISPQVQRQSSLSPRISVAEPRIAKHQRVHSTSSLHSASSLLSRGLSQASIRSAKLSPTPSVRYHRPAVGEGCSDHDEGDIEESGSSACSPWSVHGRGESFSGSAVGLSPLQPLAQIAQPPITGAPVSFPASRARDGNITIEQWASSHGLNSINPAAAMSSLSASPQDKKRKRISRSTVVTSGFPISSPITPEVYISSDEDEYHDHTTMEESDGESDAGIPVRGKKRSSKKRRTDSCSPNSSPSTSRPSSSKPLIKSTCAPDYGSSIKVHALIPIDKTTKSCPHCGFVPSNGRFSDLKRHHSKHLIDGAGGKAAWVCMLCGDVEEVDVWIPQGLELSEGLLNNRTIVTGSGEGEWRKVKIYTPHADLGMKIVKYTRKDSAKRHWQKEHGERGIVWDASHLGVVNFVMEDRQLSS